MVKKRTLNYPLFEKKQNLTEHRFKYTQSIAAKSVSCDQNCCCVVRLKLLIPFNAVLITQDEEYWICVQMGVQKDAFFERLP